MKILLNAYKKVARSKTAGSLGCVLPCTFLLIVGCVPKAALEHDNAQIDLLMAQKQAIVDQCYSNLRSTDPKSTGGQVTIRAEHNPDGSISSLSLVRGFPGSQPLYECIRKEIAGSKIAPPLTRGPVEMTWNFH